MENFIKNEPRIRSSRRRCFLMRNQLEISQFLAEDVELSEDLSKSMEAWVVKKKTEIHPTKIRRFLLNRNAPEKKQVTGKKLNFFDQTLTWKSKEF